ncbi:hypothetical protein [Dialister succinatiphilus]|uniref:hypothetical protein n=1 Tax=Dialister succinatiphilus TaxID=487173 RepID=UPI00030C5B7B|nr:hypothetical protein [Dialister succinatiphilus]
MVQSWQIVQGDDAKEAVTKREDMEELIKEARRAGQIMKMVDVTRVKRQAAWGHKH